MVWGRSRCMHLKSGKTGPNFEGVSGAPVHASIRQFFHPPSCEVCLQSFVFPRSSRSPSADVPLPEDGYILRSRTDSLLSILRFGILNEIMRDKLHEFNCTMDGEGTFD